MRLIDGEKLFEYLGDVPWTEFKKHKVLRAIYNAPTIDAEPVVRCKDCKYFELNHEDKDKLCNGIEWCTNWCGGTTAGGYCCEAERREP